jgi:hypothetical protein
MTGRALPNLLCELGQSLSFVLLLRVVSAYRQADAANQRITDPLGSKDTGPEPGDEDDGDSKKAS